MLCSTRIKIISHDVKVLFKRLSSTSTAEYCMNLVKSYDYENFLSTLLLKQNARSCAFAVRSFNVEIARIAEQVSQKETGLMRFQFWDDVINKCYQNDFGKVPRHPVAIELFKTVHLCKISKRNLKNLIIARKENLGLISFSNIEEMEKYLDKSVSSVYLSILEGHGIKDINADHAASHLGKSQGIVQQLRSIPLSKQLNFIPLPQSLLVKNNISLEEIFRCKPSKSLSDVVYEIACRAHQHLTKARNLTVPAESRSTFLPAVATTVYLDRLQQVDYDVFHPKLKHRQWNLLFKLWLSNFRNKY